MVSHSVAEASPYQPSVKHPEESGYGNRRVFACSIRSHGLIGAYNTICGTVDASSALVKARMSFSAVGEYDVGTTTYSKVVRAQY